jgi:hypothetical protein
MSSLNKKRNRENANHIITHRLDWWQASRWCSQKRKIQLNIACFFIIIMGFQNKLQHCWTRVRLFCSCITIFIWLLWSCYKAFNSTNLSCEITNSIVLQHFIVQQRLKFEFPKLVWIKFVGICLNIYLPEPTNGAHQHK